MSEREDICFSTDVQNKTNKNYEKTQLTQHFPKLVTPQELKLKVAEKQMPGKYFPSSVLAFAGFLQEYLAGMAFY